LQKKINLKIWLGIWISNDTHIFEKEKNELIQLIKSNSINSDLISGINVGSESIFRNDITLDENINYMIIIKNILKNNNIKLPISIIEIINIYYESPKLINAVDIIMFNQFPFWENIPIEDSIEQFNKKLNKVQKLNIEKKKIIVGETGWASNGINDNTSLANSINHAKYFLDFYNYANEKKIEYYYFSAIDEPWKGIQNNKTNDVESFFGLYTIDMNLKPEIQIIINNNNNPDNNKNDSNNNRFNKYIIIYLIIKFYVFFV